MSECEREEATPKPPTPDPACSPSASRTKLCRQREGNDCNGKVNSSGDREARQRASSFEQIARSPSQPRTGRQRMQRLHEAVYG